MIDLSNASTRPRRVSSSAARRLVHTKRLLKVIPKVIHYCWFSGEEMPPLVQRCVSSWKETMPEYEAVRWDAARFDVECNQFVSEAYRSRKWAFVTDYARLHALHMQGGIYLDTDVTVVKRFDEFLPYDFFTSVEYHHKVVRGQGTTGLLNRDGSSKVPFTPKYGIGIQAAVLGGVQGHPFLQDCLDYYEDKPFILDDGAFYDKLVAPDIYAMIAESYGFRYADRKQILQENMLILPSRVFASAPSSADSSSYAIHHCAGSWRTPAPAGFFARAAREAYQLFQFPRM